jgi:hypothetical protein
VFEHSYSAHIHFIECSWCILVSCLVFFTGWFGIRKDFCQFLLGVCPCLQEYGNISYSLQHDDTDSRASTPEVEKVKHFSKHKKEAIEEQPKAVVPVLSIETPD